jgi:hypothetical protein
MMHSQHFCGESEPYNFYWKRNCAAHIIIYNLVDNNSSISSFEKKHCTFGKNETVLFSIEERED